MGFRLLLCVEIKCGAAPTSIVWVTSNAASGTPGGGLHRLSRAALFSKKQGFLQEYNQPALFFIINPYSIESKNPYSHRASTLDGPMGMQAQTLVTTPEKSWAVSGMGRRDLPRRNRVTLAPAPSFFVWNPAV